MLPNCTLQNTQHRGFYVIQISPQWKRWRKATEPKGEGATVASVKLPSLLGPTYPPLATGWHFVLNFTRKPYTSLHFVRIRWYAWLLYPRCTSLSWQVSINHCGYRSDSTILSNAVRDSKRMFLLYTLPWNNIFAGEFDAVCTQGRIKGSQAQGCQSSARCTRCIRRAEMQECN